MSLTGVRDLSEAGQSESYHSEWDYPNSPCLFLFSLRTMAPDQNMVHTLK